ncbi:MAG TPA: two-component regulator propeller domain-containing protein [Ferruginibacter sp.]|nr:two-component regulator propeller domain-containing protein [Ferruginibacter sp.]
MNKWLLILFFGLLVSWPRKGISQQVLFHSYTVQDGLVANPVRTIFQDSNDFIWIGTWDGLSRYDGYKFTNFSTSNGLSNNLVNDFIERDNILYVAENDGTIDGIQNKRVQKLFKSASPVNRFLKVDQEVTIISTDKNGLYELRGNKFVKPSQQLENHSLQELLRINDSLFISHSGDISLQVFTNEYQIFSTTNMQNTYLGGMIRDSQNRIWVCTSRGLKLISLPLKKNGPVEFLPLPATFNIPILADGVINDILENKDGSFWIGTHKGLVYLEPSGKYTVYTEMNGLPSPVITTIFRDKEKNIWIGTALGLAKYTGLSNVRTIKNDVIDFTFSPTHELVLATSTGIRKFQHKPGYSNELIKGSPSHYALFVKGSNPLLFYFSDSIGTFDPSSDYIVGIKRFPGLALSDYASCTDQNGHSFIATNHGFAVFTHKSMYVDPSLPYRITSLAIDQQGYLWAGTWDAGLFRIRYQPDGDSLKFMIEEQTSLVKTKEVRSIFCDSKGNTWVGTRNNGAFCLTPKRNGYVVKNFDKSSGLISNFITAFNETGNGDMWVGSYLGIDKLVKENNHYRVFNFSSVTNLFVQVSAIVPGQHSTLYGIAYTNLFRFTDPGLEQHGAPDVQLFSVILTGVKTKDTLTDFYNNISLSHKRNDIKIEFGALSFINEKQIFYSYRLKGSKDTSWSKPQNGHEVFYASLSPGKYRFEVRAEGYNGIPGRPSSFAFTINPPFWKTTWFYIICAFCIIAILAGIVRYRVSQLIKWQKARERIATDLHDDIGSALTSISILSSLSNKNLEQPEKVRPFLALISEKVQASSQAMDDIIWSVNSHNDSIQETLARMRRYAGELFDNSDIKYHLDVEEFNGYKKMNMEQRRDVYLAYKEALNNIYKHAGATNVWITITQHHHLKMNIKDDGKGFNTSVPTHRNGLKNLQLRVKKWKGTFHIRSGDSGTEIDMVLPLAN